MDIFTTRDYWYYGIYSFFFLAVLTVIQFSIIDEIKRRKIPGSSILFSVGAIILGFAASDLIFYFRFPERFLDHPLLSFLGLWGGNYYAGLFGGFIVLFLIARFYRSPVLAVLDAIAPIGASFALFDVGLAVLPLWWLIVVVVQSRVVSHSSGKPRPDGLVFSIFLMVIGFGRTIVIYLRYGTSNIWRPDWAQIANFLCFTLGVILLVAIKSKFHKQSKEHRILNDAVQHGLAEQPESKSPTPECPHPERWRMYDAMTAEVEVLEFLKTLVTTVKPNLVVETGTFMGVSTLWIAEGLKQNGFGRVITCEYDPKTYAAAKKRFDESGLGEWIDCRLGSSLELNIEGTIDILFSDSDLALREREVRRFLPRVNPTGIILMHDASSHLKVVREAALRLEQEGLISVLLLPTPRGLVIAQKRAGRI